MTRQSIICLVTIISGLLLTGCMQSMLLYDDSGMQPERSWQETEKNQNTILITTVDGTQYILSGWTRDSVGTIDGVGRRTPWPVNQPNISFEFSGRITADSIQNVSTKEFDVLATILFAGVLGLIAVTVLYLSSPQDGFGLAGEFGKALGGSSW